MTSAPLSISDPRFPLPFRPVTSSSPQSLHPSPLPRSSAASASEPLPISPANLPLPSTPYDMAPQTQHQPPNGRDEYPHGPPPSHQYPPLLQQQQQTQPNAQQQPQQSAVHQPSGRVQQEPDQLQSPFRHTHQHQDPPQHYSQYPQPQQPMYEQPQQHPPPYDPSHPRQHDQHQHQHPHQQLYHHHHNHQLRQEQQHQQHEHQYQQQQYEQHRSNQSSYDPHYFYPPHPAVPPSSQVAPVPAPAPTASPAQQTGLPSLLPAPPPQNLSVITPDHDNGVAPPPGYDILTDIHVNQVASPAQSSPRQRTSIACRYCRKRKIRCSGYTTTGSCSNCSRMHQECVFQPVSSSNSTAFVPLNAVHGRTITPGTQMYGSFGQPLGDAPNLEQVPTFFYAARPGYYPPPMPSIRPPPQSPTEVPLSYVSEMRLNERMPAHATTARNRRNSNGLANPKRRKPRRRSTEKRPSPRTVHITSPQSNHQLERVPQTEAWVASQSPYQLPVSSAMELDLVTPLEAPRPVLPTISTALAGTCVPSGRRSPASSICSEFASHFHHKPAGNVRAMMSMSNLLESPNVPVSDMDRNMLGRLDGLRR